ncbi:CBS domain-containing protein [Halobium salinum]|uniref:CBS domain-containing protein n=1 Tax=Halobium salinum TaxID=1364940 RepID=A0ABD5PES6_9EURY|nr:CBS domain-containing protein [Halobium salinum]
MREDTTVYDLMGREFVGVSESDSVVDAAELLVEEEVDFVVVVRGREPVGEMTARDAVEALLDGGPERGETVTVGSVMDEAAARIDARADVDEAVDRLLSESATHLLVVDGDDIVGVLTERDVMAATSSRGPESMSEADVIETNGGFDVEESAPVDSDYSNQSICEVCGALSRELSNRNGQLVCADCREV